MKEIFRQANTTNGENIEIDYHLIYNIVDNYKTYGITIKLYKLVDTIAYLDSIETIPNITYSYKECRRIVTLLCKNLVTPCTLLEILDDLDILLQPKGTVDDHFDIVA